MFSNLRGRITSAHVIALAALFVALGGTAFAAATVGTNDIKNGAVTTDKLRNKAVTRQKIADEAVVTRTIKDNAVKTDKIADQAVSTDKITDQAVSTDKIADQAVSTDKIADGAVTSAKVDGSIVTSTTVGVPMAGMNIAADGTVRRFFSRVGGEPTISHTADTGQYDLTIPGLEGQVLNSSSVSLATVQTGGFGDVATISSSGGNPRIRTANGAGAAADRSFEYVIFQPSP